MFISSVEETRWNSLHRPGRRNLNGASPLSRLGSHTFSYVYKYIQQLQKVSELANLYVLPLCPDLYLFFFPFISAVYCDFQALNLPLGFSFLLIFSIFHFLNKPKVLLGLSAGGICFEVLQ